MNILDMSLYASILIIAIMVFRTIALYRIPKKIFLLLWSLVIARLLLPYSFANPLSAMQIMTFDTATVFTENLVYTASMSISPIVIAWLMGAIGILGWFSVAYYKGFKELSASLPVDNAIVQKWLSEHKIKRHLQVRVSDRIKTPLTYGIIKPVIVLPKSTDWNNADQLNYILIHEWTHIKRFDGILKLALAFVLSIHWFNPLVWAMYVLANRDIELSCDDDVIREIGLSQKSAYAHTLVDLSCDRGGGTAIFSNFSRFAVEERINAIVKSKQSRIAGIAVMTLALIVMVVIFTSPLSADNPEGMTNNEGINAVSANDPINQGNSDPLIIHSSSD